MRTFVLFTILAVSTVFAGNWRQWRGPDFNSVSNDVNLPASLNEKTLLWSTPLPGAGEATPVVFGERVYVAGYRKDIKSTFAQCFSTTTGKQRWYNGVEEVSKLPPRKIIASPSPVADATGCVFLYSDGTLVKYDPDGLRLWKRNLVDEYGPLKMYWSYSSSPLLYDGRIYIQALRNATAPEGYTGSMDSYLLAVDPATGENIFKFDRATDAVEEFTNAYTTPIPITINKTPYVVIYGGNYITGHDPATGVEQWRFGYMDEEIPGGRAAGTPVADATTLYCPFPMGKKILACDLGKLAANESPVVWTLGQGSCDVPSPVLVDGYLYMIADSKKTLTCVEAKTGLVQWTGQLDKSDTYYASITAGDGKLYMVNRKGIATVVAANPKAFEILSTHDFGENPVDSTISIADGKLYLRTAERLYCFGKK